MTHQNLILTEKAIKNHSKRLQKELKKFDPNLSLGEAQNLFSKSLGFNNWNHLSSILSIDIVNNLNFNLNLDSLEHDDKVKLIKQLISQENLLALKQYLNYFYLKATNSLSSISPSDFERDLIFIITLLKFQNVSFQEDVTSAIIDIIEKNKKTKIIDSEDLMAKFCSLKIKTKTLHKITGIFPFKKNDFNVGLIIACENNNTEMVQFLIYKYNLDIDYFFYIGDDKTVFNPLCSAIRSNSYETIDLLLYSPLFDKNSNIMVEDNNPLKMACKVGNLELVRVLLTSDRFKNKANMYSENCICLLFACENDHWNIVDFLLNEMNIKVNPDFYKEIKNRKLKFFTDIAKQNKLQKMILKYN